MSNTTCRARCGALGWRNCRATTRYIRYDQRGCGLSDRDVTDLSLDAWVGDLEAVVDALGLKRFPLFGMSQGGAVAIAYAARHPERVSHLVFAGAYARGSLRRNARRSRPARGAKRWST